MKPLAHARLCAARRGGTWGDTIALQTWLDSSKATFAGVQHRALLHHDLGAEIAQRIFGTLPVNGTLTPARDLITDHVTEDLGSLVSVTRWLDAIDLRAMQTRRVEPHRRSVLALRTDALRAAATRWGGTPSLYAPIVDLLDLPSTMSNGHPRARSLFHNSFGPFLIEQVLGAAIAIDDKRVVPTRTVVEDLILARVGWIPPASFILGCIPMLPWMAGADSTAAIAARKIIDLTIQQGSLSA
jgi:hypothetical protein